MHSLNFTCILPVSKNNYLNLKLKPDPQACIFFLSLTSCICKFNILKNYSIKIKCCKKDCNKIYIYIFFINNVHFFSHLNEKKNGAVIRLKCLFLIKYQIVKHRTGIWALII